MPSFGTKSKRVLAECEQDIQDVLNEAIKHIQEITPKRIQELAQKYLNWEDMTIVSAG